MANKGKRETKKQITEVKQEIQKDLDKMGRVHSHIPSQQIEQASAIHNKSIVPPTDLPSMTTSRKSSPNLEKNKSKSSVSNKQTSYKNEEKKKTQKKIKPIEFEKDEEEKESKRKGRPKGAKDKQPRKKSEFNRTGRPKGAKDKQPRKQRQPKTMIEEAQEKMTERRQELDNITDTPQEVIDRISKQDDEARERFQSDKEYAYAFYRGEIIENRIYDMCNDASNYKWTSASNRAWVKGILEASKQMYGEEEYYDILWNKQGDVLANSDFIIWESDGQVGTPPDLEAKDRLRYILL